MRDGWSGPAGRAALLLAAALTLVGCSSDGDAGLRSGTPDLRVSSAQASAPVAGASQLVLSIENRGDGDDRLVAVDSDAALAVEVHRTIVEDDGRAVMRLLEDVLLPASGTVDFRPGGLHLMLVVPDERVVVGGTFTIELRFARSAPIIVDVAVVDLLDLIDGDDRSGG